MKATMVFSHRTKLIFNYYLYLSLSLFHFFPTELSFIFLQYVKKAKFPQDLTR